MAGTEQALRVRIDELEEQVHILKGAIADLDLCLPTEWGLTAFRTNFIRALAKREVVTFAALDALLYSDSPEARCRDTIKVHAHHVRKKLEPFGIEITAVWGVGYSLDAATRARLTQQQPTAATAA
ncbi:winged helix-turn-helix domain-containing protein [Taklimakanibacter deserti]|uniref:winged helix-turn-helix domain-containing protein n=1 Tax=Taklimakanibacter deserti TaxID=2267839 RepID=UPI000E652AFA